MKRGYTTDTLLSSQSHIYHNVKLRRGAKRSIYIASPSSRHVLEVEELVNVEVLEWRHVVHDGLDAEFCEAHGI